MSHFVIICLCFVQTALSSVTVVFGADFNSSTLLRSRIAFHASRVNIDDNITLALGTTGLCDFSVKALGPEGYELTFNASAKLFCALGNVQKRNAMDSSKITANRGNVFAAFAALQQLNVHFLHPFETVSYNVSTKSLSPRTAVSSAHWPVRGFHYHTEHPLELQDLLGGFDAGNESWSSMLPQFIAYCEWLVAHEQNALEWVLLWQPSFNTFAWSKQRQDRFVQLSGIAHEYGIAVGADVSIVDIQQHAWHFVTNSSDPFAQIRALVDWLKVAGFDYISTENGFSEFTHGSCALMLSYMNYLTSYARDVHDSSVFIKCHCSTGQHCKNEVDPRTGEPLNFNFLPMLANSSLGVYPHTVQMYTFDDPAPTYGNENFTYMFDFLMYESSRRPVIYHGETAYWVNLYADARIYDLAKIRAAEKSSKMLGQIDFSSGFEWSYWLGDLITARAARQGGKLTSAAAFSHISSVLFHAGPPTVAMKFSQLLLDVTAAQKDLLIYGNWSGKAPKDVVKRNGIGLITGWATWSESAKLGILVGIAGAAAGLTNADRISLQISHIPNATSPSYDEIRPLLQAMTSNFTTLSIACHSLLQHAPNETYEYVEEKLWNTFTTLIHRQICDTLNITALRASFEFALYDYTSSWLTGSAAYRKKRLDSAQSAISKARAIVDRRQKAYRVPLSRIASWGKNPTAYNFGYLWSVKSLHYWYRDYKMAVDTELLDLSPCLYNIVNAVDVSIGEGVQLNVTELVYKLFSHFKWASPIDDCLSFPEQEPKYSF